MYNIPRTNKERMEKTRRCRRVPFGHTFWNSPPPPSIIFTVHKSLLTAEEGCRERVVVVVSNTLLWAASTGGGIAHSPGNNQLPLRGKYF